jgi:hypothetical protein
MTDSSEYFARMPVETTPALPDEHGWLEVRPQKLVVPSFRFQ